MWYYETHGRVQGPISQAELCDLVQTGRLSIQTLVWQEGLPNWKKFSETGLIDHLEEGATPPDYDSEVIAAQDPLASKTLNTINWLFAFFVIGCVFSLIMLASYPLLVSVVLNENQAAIIAFSLIYQFFSLGANASFVLECILLYQFWKLVQDGNARTTPGRAVGFLFIPLFNFYWMFIAYWGLAKELKRYISVHCDETGEEKIRRPKAFLSFLMAMSPLISGVFIVAYFMFFAISISMQSPEILEQNPQRIFMSMMYPFLGLGGFVSLLRLAVYSDFYLSVRSILEGKCTK
ncbi:MAG: DUF4339 domain-containing protein [Anaerolineaceae bacterium]|nr:DUF4339 domain-containing protein [Anaerolineaceae bacterium]